MFNKKIKKMVLSPSCVMVVGDRRVGKSTLFALICDESVKKGMKVYSQYPYQGCYQIPVECVNYGSKSHPNYKYIVNKKWLYTTDLTDSVVLLDEAKTIYNSRAWNSWSVDDEEFFNFLGKYNCRVYLATQAYDCVDLNVKRATDEIWYISKTGFLGRWFSRVETYHTTVAPVADKNTMVQGSLFKPGMYKLNWEIVSVPLGVYRLYRPHYYDKFKTLFTYEEKIPSKVDKWDKLFSSEASHPDEDNSDKAVS